MLTQAATGPITCAWCTAQILDGTDSLPSTYGICVSCLGQGFATPVQNLEAISDADADRLPFGMIRMDGEGRVVAYNAKESALSGLHKADVLGRNFFRTVAPCTCVEEFEGLVRKMMASERPLREEIQFLFKFKNNATMAQIAVTTNPWSGYATLLVRKADGESQ